MNERQAKAQQTSDSIVAAIERLTVLPDRFPSPSDVAKYLGISRQLVRHYALLLEQAGRLVRLNHGHALKLI